MRWRWQRMASLSGCNGWAALHLLHAKRLQNPLPLVASNQGQEMTLKEAVVYALGKDEEVNG